MKNLKNEVKLTSVEVVKGYEPFTTIRANFGLVVEKIGGMGGYSPRHKNVRKGKGWTFVDICDAPENINMVLHNKGLGLAMSVYTASHLNDYKLCIKIGKEVVCEIFQYYSSNSGRTIGIGVNLADGWERIFHGQPVCHETGGILTMYHEGRVWVQDPLCLGKMEEKTVTTFSGQKLTYLISDLLDFKNRGADLFAKEKVDNSKWVRVHRSFHDKPEAMMQMHLMAKQCLFNISQHNGVWYHCSAEMHRGGDNIPGAVGAIRKIKQPKFLGWVQSQTLNKEYPVMDIDDTHVIGAIHRYGDKHVTWVQLEDLYDTRHPFEGDPEYMELMLGVYGIHKVRKEAMTKVHSHPVSDIYQVVEQSTKERYLVTGKKLRKNDDTILNYMVYHIGADESIVDAIVKFLERVLSKEASNMDVNSILQLPNDFIIKLSDSRAVGNCESGTMSFANRIWGIDKGDTNAIITKKMILEMWYNIMGDRDFSLFKRVITRLQIKMGIEK